MNIEKLSDAALFTEINSKILEVALDLVDDNQYTKEAADAKLIELAKFVDENSTIRMIQT